MNKNCIKSTLNCEAYSSFEGEASDHRIVITKIHLSLRRNTAQTKTIQCDWSLLNNRVISYKYTIILQKKFNALQEISETLTPNDEYENFINVHTAAEYKLSKEQNKRVPCEALTDKKKTRQHENSIPL